MFENILGQESVKRLSEDYLTGTLPGSLLFVGPAASARGSAALELARVLSCEKRSAEWNCSCNSCESHRRLSHSDLLLFGPKDFSAEILASAAAFTREPLVSTRMLFIRSLQKLLSRFNPTLWEGDETKLGKAATLATSLQENLEELSILSDTAENLAKQVNHCVQDALKLESEGISDTIPVSQIRRLSAWARLAPHGRKKVAILENADRMQDSSRNAMLKLLEEPPENTVLILTVERRNSLLPTVLSRLRPYSFVKRASVQEQDVIRRVFKDSEAVQKQPSQDLHEYLDSFLPVNRTRLRGLAASFSAAVCAASLQETRSVFPEPPTVRSLRRILEDSTELLRQNALPEPPNGAREAAAFVATNAESFQVRRLFSVFSSMLTEQAAFALRDVSCGPHASLLAGAWSRCIANAESAVCTYNQSAPLALERLYDELVHCSLYPEGRETAL